MSARVLIVGNEETLLETRKAILQRKHEAVATTPEHALALIAETRFDLLLLCHSVPAPQARELVKALYEQHLKIIIIRMTSAESSSGNFPVVDRIVGPDCNPREWIAAIDGYLEMIIRPTFS